MRSVIFSVMGVVTSDLGLRCVGAMADPVTPRIHPAICGMFLGLHVFGWGDTGHYGQLI